MTEFARVVNRTIHEPSKRPFIQVKHGPLLHKVDIITDPLELQEVKAFDDKAFAGFQGIDLVELHGIAANGRVLGLKDKNGELVGESQVLLSPIPGHSNLAQEEAYCYGIAVRSDVRGQGLAQVLYKAQEVTAREAGKGHLSLTVRPENGSNIRAALRSGYRITGFDSNRYGPPEQGGARAVMVKELQKETFPFAPSRLREMLKAGDISAINARLNQADHSSRVLDIGISIPNEGDPDLEIYTTLERFLKSGYMGIGLLLPNEHGLPNNSNLLVLHDKERPMAVDKPEFKPAVFSETGKLKEVLVAYATENSQTTEETAINAVSQQNIGNHDSIAEKDEYNTFVETLEAQGIKVIRTHAQVPPEFPTTTPVFTRDPSFTIGESVVVGKMKRDPRQYETKAVHEIFEDALDLTNYDDAFIEGGDIIQLDAKTVLVGIGQRTNENGLRLLQQKLPGFSFIGVNHPELHLDVLFTVLGKNKVLANVEQLPGEFLDYIKTRGMDIVVSDPNEQETLGCNVLAIDDNKVVAVAENVETNRRLKEAGVEVIEVSMPNIIKSGGGPRCMTCPVNRE